MQPSSFLKVAKCCIFSCIVFVRVVLENFVKILSNLSVCWLVVKLFIVSIKEKKLVDEHQNSSDPLFPSKGSV